MEPITQDFPPGNQRFSELSWLVKTKYQRAPPAVGQTETNFPRGNLSIEILDTILPETQHRPNILLIGLGLKRDPVMCCYGPFRIAAHLQGKGRDYTMTLVDNDPEVISDVRNRRNLYLTYEIYQAETAHKHEKAWNKYLTDTKQRKRIALGNEKDLKFPSYTKGEVRWKQYYLDKGIVTAAVTPQFRTKLLNGEIILIQDDIAVANIIGTEPYDYVELMNVLYLMTAQGQQLALANISSSMRIGGRLLINDIGGYSGVPVFTRLGGWLDVTKMEELGFRIEKVIFHEDMYETALLIKIK